MKKSLAAYLIVIACFSLGACAREKPYVKPHRPPGPETVVIPRTEKGELPKPYQVNGERYYPLPDAEGFVEYGTASWYGGKFHGRPTASGETYDMYKKTAAHRILPLQTYTMVTNLSNKKQTVVRINDRGPFVKGRVIDLSYAAGKEIGLIGPGTAEVKVVALGKEVGSMKTGEGPGRPIVERKDLKKGPFTIQVGAFQDRKNARNLADRLRVLFDYVAVSVYVDESGRTFYRVRISKSDTLGEAKALEKKLERMGFSEAFVVSLQG
jgi:rare lipoprotein A